MNTKILRVAVPFSFVAIFSIVFAIGLKNHWWEVLPALFITTGLLLYVGYWGKKKYGIWFVTREESAKIDEERKDKI